ncbi:helix-hairpin-helix domain-containing protein [Streptomyces sp. NPDC012693]|uniref:ComEA family DNA-binding protein n=1 Tax=unclassified Streptomyces TaxID=2593676 RepID=UPI0020306B22|nr:ComEA family DNA-binding protein [Streptomyces sp. MSC1_001]
MTLRTRIASTGSDVLGTRGAASSGPGRARGSDGRGRHGARGASSGRAGGRTRVRRAAPLPEAVVRRRGDALFPSAAAGPRVPEPPAGREATEVLEAPERGSPVGTRGRLAAALRERTPMWVQTRCGLEPRALAALAVILIVAAGLAGGYFWAGRPEPVRAPELVRAVPVAAAPATRAAPVPGAVAGSAPGGARVIVDVGGKVRRPGVLTLPAGSRVADALRAAGGAKPDADLTGLNRARVLFDGEQVLVGVPGAPAGAPGPGSGPAGGPGGGGPGAPLSLNTATVEQLDTLPGVGPVLARHIVDHRTEHGGFRSVGELREVNGIGERRFADLEPLVRP